MFFAGLGAAARGTCVGLPAAAGLKSLTRAPALAYFWVPWAEDGPPA